MVSAALRPDRHAGGCGAGHAHDLNGVSGPGAGFAFARPLGGAGITRALRRAFSVSTWAGFLGGCRGWGFQPHTADGAHSAEIAGNGGSKGSAPPRENAATGEFDARFHAIDAGCVGTDTDSPSDHGPPRDQGSGRTDPLYTSRLLTSRLLDELHATVISEAHILFAIVSHRETWISPDPLACARYVAQYRAHAARLDDAIEDFTDTCYASASASAAHAKSQLSAMRKEAQATYGSAINEVHRASPIDADRAGTVVSPQSDQKVNE